MCQCLPPEFASTDMLGHLSRPSRCSAHSGRSRVEEGRKTSDAYLAVNLATQDHVDAKAAPLH